MTSKIVVKGLDLWYGRSQALIDINLSIPERSVTAIIGPSGCGKSTFIRCLNRMNDHIDGCRVKGNVRIDGQEIYNRNYDKVQLRRNVGMVFQKPNPFPFSIYDNITYGLKMAGIRNRKLLDRLVYISLRRAGILGELDGRLEEDATDLSGGQQQRLCIARALAMGPEVILMDEPCSALDPISTNAIEDLIRELREEYTVVIVTHNMEQAVRVSDFTAFLHLGKMVEFDTTSQIFIRPKDQRTLDYISGRFG